MCYSAMVRQNIAALARRFGAEVAWELFEDLFLRRVTDNSVKMSRALEANFSQPNSLIEGRIKGNIDAYSVRKVTEWEQDLFRQKERLADAERSLAKNETKGARERARIAAKKIKTNIDRITDVRRTELRASDSRIFPMTYAPVLVQIEHRRLIWPMRYGCRLAGKPANYDVRYPGTYNARRDNLNGFWSGIYSHRHAVMVINGFYENVPQHAYEHRELKPGEKESNLVLHFNPKPAVEMLVACVWDHWSGPGQPDLYSFAAITDDPPPEISATGHQRCVIAIREKNLNNWLEPSSVGPERLHQILDEQESVYYDHQIYEERIAA